MSETNFKTKMYTTKTIINNWLTFKPHLKSFESNNIKIEEIDNALDLADVYDN